MVSVIRNLVTNRRMPAPHGVNRALDADDSMVSRRRTPPFRSDYVVRALRSHQRRAARPGTLVLQQEPRRPFAGISPDGQDQTASNEDKLGHGVGIRSGKSHRAFDQDRRIHALLAYVDGPGEHCSDHVLPIRWDSGQRSCSVTGIHGSVDAPRSIEHVDERVVPKVEEREIRGNSLSAFAVNGTEYSQLASGVESLKSNGERDTVRVGGRITSITAAEPNSRIPTITANRAGIAIRALPFGHPVDST